MSTIAKYIQAKAAIEKFRAHAKSGKSASDLDVVFGRIITGVPKIAMTIASGIPLYRCRQHEKGSLFNHVQDLRYPPSNRVSRRGRFNEVGESIFYCSNTELGTLVEMDPTLEKIYTMAVVQQRPDAPVPIVMRFRHADDDDLMLTHVQPTRTAHERLVDSFIMEELSRPGAEIGYEATIAIGRFCFGKGLKFSDSGEAFGPHGTHKNLAITYPSVKAPGYTNQRTYNVAMLPATFDQCFFISGAELYSLTHDDASEVIRLTSLNTAVVASEGELTWKYGFREMIERIANGIHGNGQFDEKLKIAAANL